MTMQIGGLQVGMLEIAKWARDVELPLTCNCIHGEYRQFGKPKMAHDLDAEKLEIAQVQFWALK